MATFFLKQNDTGPSMVAVLTGADGSTVNIAGAVVRFHMKNLTNNALVIDRAATIVTAATGSVRYDWQAADTLTPGMFLCEYEVTYSDGTTETFPNNDKIIVSIEGEVN